VELPTVIDPLPEASVDQLLSVAGGSAEDAEHLPGDVAVGELVGAP